MVTWSWMKFRMDCSLLFSRSTYYTFATSNPEYKIRFHETIFLRVKLLELPTHLYVREVVDRISRAPPPPLLSKEMQEELQKLVDGERPSSIQGAQASAEEQAVFQAAAANFGMSGGVAQDSGAGFGSARTAAAAAAAAATGEPDEDTAYNCLVRCGEGQFRRLFKLRDSLGTTMLGVAASRGWLRVVMFTDCELYPTL